MAHHRLLRAAVSALRTLSENEIEPSLMDILQPMKVQCYQVLSSYLGQQFINFDQLQDSLRNIVLPAVGAVRDFLESYDAFTSYTSLQRLRGTVQRLFYEWVLDGLRDNPQFNGGPNADGPLLNNVQEIMVAILQIRDPDILED